MPALAVATSVAGERRQFQLGCDEDARFRIASITKPMTASLAVQLLDLDEQHRESGPTTCGSATCWRTSPATAARSATCARFGEGDDALGAAVAELPSVERLVPLDAAWSYANTGYWLAGWLAARQNGSTYEEALQEHVLGPAGLAEATFGSPSLERHRPRGRRRRLSARPPPFGRARRDRSGGRPLRRLAAAAAVDERAAGAAREAAGRRLRARLLRRARGGDRHLGPPRLLRRLPVHAAAGAEPRRLARRADEQQPRQPGPARRRGRLVRGGARRPAPRRTDGRARAGGARPARRHLRERGHDGRR